MGQLKDMQIVLEDMGLVAVDFNDLKKLERVMKSLYEDNLNFDQRRDLAKVINCILDNYQYREMVLKEVHG